MSVDAAEFASDWPVVGHRRAIEMLRRSMRTGLLSHAYLFTGPAGIGKRTLALAFAMALNCESGIENASPCGLCSSCGRTKRGEHPDVTEASLASQAAALADEGASSKQPPKEIRIDTIRDLQRGVSLSPYLGRWKVLIIDDADRLSEEAANSLLKTLEEPPADTVLILLAPDDGSVLPTIASRCVLVPLRPLPRPEVARALVDRWGADGEQASRLASLSGGRVGWAVRMLTERIALERRGRALEDIAMLSGAPVVERIDLAAKYAKKFSEARPELFATLDTWEGWWRDVLVVGASSPDLAFNQDQDGTLRSVARRVDPSAAASSIRLIQATRRQLLENVNPRLALESLMLGLP